MIALTSASVKWRLADSKSVPSGASSGRSASSGNSRGMARLAACASLEVARPVRTTSWAPSRRTMFAVCMLD